MSEIKHRERILEAIDQLRRRKARPDIQRICNFLMRRFSISSSDTQADLQKCVEDNVVLKVEYKGNISYRNAAKKFPHLKRQDSQDGENAKPNRKFGQILTNAIAELIVQEPDYLELGVPGSELVRNILSKEHVKYTKKYVAILLEKEVVAGGLSKMENGNYLVGPTKTENYDFSDDRRDKKKKTHDEEEDDRKEERGGEAGANLRVGSRRKRAKKVFDPSDHNLPKKRGRPIGSLNKSTIEKQLAKLNDGDARPESRSSNSSREQGGVCSVCHAQNKRGPNDRMVACRECSNKAHFSCLNGDDMMLRMYPDNTWQCPHCKTCVVCFETSDAGNLIVCSICADAYHLGCHEPRIAEKVRNGGKWLCINCQMSEQLEVTEIQPNLTKVDIHLKHTKPELTSPTPSVSGNSSPNYQSPIPSPTPPTLSPQAATTTRSSNHSPDLKCNSDSQSYKDFDWEENIDPSIPDATNWTFEEVYNYFAQYFPEEAKVFKEQEIDGHSLLLMKRMDVLTSLKLKLGPALKIYRHVVKLQVRRDDPKLYWL